MKKYFQIIAMFGILLFLVWLRNAKFEDDVTLGIKPNNKAPTPTEIPTQMPSVTPSVNIKTSVTATPTSAPIVTPLTPKGLYRDGVYTGSVQDAYYGNVQIKVVIAAGKITDVVFMQFPNDNPTSQNINSQAMPLLKQEAIAAQSANVSGVTGASATSPAFIASLQDALAQAKN